MTQKSASAAPETALLATPEEVKSFREQQEEEWGQYVAVQPVSIGGVLAYNPGDPVPASNVKRHGYEKAGLVASTGSPEAKKLAADLHSVHTSDLPEDFGQPVTLGVQVR